jgi:hypothetical protein
MGDAFSVREDVGRDGPSCEGGDAVTVDRLSGRVELSERRKSRVLLPFSGPMF